MVKLGKTDDRYDWMVVAFLTKNSHHDTTKSLNKHILTGFTEVTKGEVSVAIARQVKGTHTKAIKVKQAIDMCLVKSVLCYKVAEKLSKCKETVETIVVSETYTAVHAFRLNAHDGHGAKNIQGEEVHAPELYHPLHLYREMS